jgi:uncharacterized membrane protein HdeD (DUF308 family)
MRIALARNWWSLVLRGLLGIILGILTFAWPGVTLMVLVFLFAAYALVNGVFSIIGAIRAVEHRERWGALVLEGIVGIAAAVITVLFPPVTALALVYLVGAWAILTGCLEIASAVRLRRVVSGEWLLFLGGVASVLFGFMLFIWPIAGALVLALWVGVYWLVFGVTLVALGLRLHSWERHGIAGGPMPAPAH